MSRSKMPSNSCASPKPLALLIPGIDGTGRFYDRQIVSLSVRYRVRAWEFRSRGRFGFRDLVEELAEATAAEERRTILVVGESFGGPVALHFTLAYPERVRALALINAFSYHRWRIRTYLASHLVSVVPPHLISAMKHFVVDRVLASEGIPLEDRRRYREIIRLVCHEAYCRRLELVREVNLQDELESISVPTYLFASGRDKMVPSRAEARFMAARIRNATLYDFPQAGHALLLTPGFYLSDYF